MSLGMLHSIVEALFFCQQIVSYFLQTKCVLTSSVFSFFLLIMYTLKIHCSKLYFIWFWLLLMHGKSKQKENAKVKEKAKALQSQGINVPLMKFFSNYFPLSRNMKKIN